MLLREDVPRGRDSSRYYKLCPRHANTAKRKSTLVADGWRDLNEYYFLSLHSSLFVIVSISFGGCV